MKLNDRHIFETLATNSFLKHLWYLECIHLRYQIMGKKRKLALQNAKYNANKTDDRILVLNSRLLFRSGIVEHFAAM